MKKIIYLIYFISMCMAITVMPSCKKLIEIPDNVPGQLQTAEVFADSTTAISGVSGIYYNAFVNGGSVVVDVSLYPSLSADDIVSPTNSSSILIYSNNALLAGGAGVTAPTSFTWNSFYGASEIYQANAAIEGITASPTLSSTLKNQLIGECEVVRALVYFDLVNLFGPCPLAITTDYKINSKLPRAPVDSIYSQIKKDLADAINRLPVTYPSAGRARPNKYTAMALLSRVNLYQQQWSNALTNANTIINSGIYSLETPLDNVFIIGNKEAIWQGVGSGSFPSSTYIASNDFIPFSATSTPQYALTSFLLNAFELNDQRKVSWTKSTIVSAGTFSYPYKLKNANGNLVNARVEGDVIFRLAEQYLIRAEASAQLGDLTGAALDLNKIRNRAGLPNTTAATQTTLLDAIAKERRVEFFCEQGHRWFDLKRTGTANSVLGAEKPGVWPVDGHALLYPIPYDQILLNPGWLQNPGY